MTTSLAIAEPAPATRLSGLALTIALRELRTGAGGLVVFVLCIALGVAAVAAIGSLAAAFNKALANQGRLLIGGDLSFEVVHRQATAEEAAALHALGQVSESASFRAMARASDGKTALVEVKAVDTPYPLYGDVNVIEPEGAATAWRTPGTVLVQPILLERLGLKIGDTLQIGDATARVGGTLGQQPDRLADRLSYGPKVLMSRETLDKTGLVQPGSLIRWTYRVKMPGDAGANRDNLDTARKAMEAAFPQSGFAIRDWTDPAPSLRRDAARFTQFISFVGLTALLLGGIGVGNAIQSYMAKKRDVIATFKCLGATSRLVLDVYMIQSLMLAAVGIAIGLALGALAPLAVATLYEDALPITLAVEPHPIPLIVAALAGLLTMVLFVLWPLGRASRISPARLMRAGLTDERGRSAAPFALGSAAAGLALLVLAVAASEERLVTAAISVGILAAFGLLLGFGALVQRFAARHRRTKPPALALAWASIGAPGSLARAIAVSLGLGLGLLIAVALIHNSLLAEIEGHVEVDAPAYYFLDVEPDDLAIFKRTAKAAEPKAKMDNAPMLRGRIVELNGVPVDEAEVSPNTRWVISGDRGLTYTDSIPGASKVEEGKWWPKGYDGPPLVSFDGELADGLGLKLGDMVTVNILGRNVEAKIASMRKIDWESLAINFVMVFSPNTLEGAPHRLVTTLELPKGTTPETEAKIVQALAERFPLVTAIKIGDIVDAAKAMLTKLMAAISATAGFTLLIGAAVLAGAVSAGQQRRTYLAVLYKTLGATRRRILSAELIEFGLLGVTTALLAIIIATITAWALCTFAFDIAFVFDPLAALGTVAIALLLVLTVGAITTWRVLSVKAAPYLRAE
ncbi:MAG: FtsX-like permease family protein [Methyloceanibacter sp.]|uniref:ABC transporter permease n=1 Tax=Methyloceanibacter sp. TaxID=1965321 RepID=UPI001E134132|nr:FtsX-like permease family protein [Methyloceanibacter sp.]MCB1444168.1 FtsX-like permease family protein [Methyloceanibacter sp.]MCC0059397.1 FtsX-like permease family protein [Hyphomicrobiaceae bacterium]